MARRRSTGPTRWPPTMRCARSARRGRHRDSHALAAQLAALYPARSSRPRSRDNLAVGARRSRARTSSRDRGRARHLRPASPTRLSAERPARRRALARRRACRAQPAIRGRRSTAARAPRVAQGRVHRRQLQLDLARRRAAPGRSDPTATTARSGARRRGVRAPADDYPGVDPARRRALRARAHARRSSTTTPARAARSARSSSSSPDGNRSRAARSLQQELAAHDRGSTACTRRSARATSSTAWTRRRRARRDARAHRPAGSGKSVLAKILCGLEQPDAADRGARRERRRQARGRARRLRQRIGMLFQNNALFDFMTVGDNVAFPLRSSAAARRRDCARASPSGCAPSGSPAARTS